jgi:3-deoxy-D-manno-octulosonic-acid transferase
MQSEKDAERIKSLGIDVGKVQVTGNLKFDLSSNEGEVELTRQLKRRFQFDGSRPLIVAASTHEPEEKLVLRSLVASLSHDARLLIAPRHPERFDSISELLENSKCRFVRRSDPESEHDRSADVILLDSIGELRAVYPLAEIAFVGGSLIPHGGQSILEPAALAKPIITGPYTHNFDDAVKVFLDEDAMVQLPETKNEEETVELLSQEFEKLLHNVEGRAELSAKTKAVMNANRGATDVTVRRLRKLVEAE